MSADSSSWSKNVFLREEQLAFPEKKMVLIDVCQLLIILNGNTKRRLRRQLMGKVKFCIKSASPLTDVSGDDASLFPKSFRRRSEGEMFLCEKLLRWVRGSERV